MRTEDFIKQVRQQAQCEPELTEIFVNCYTNTLDTTIRQMDDGTVHVITGDIPAMWLRDSAAQLRPYLFQAKDDEELRELIAGVVRRQFYFLCIDAYANAFNDSPSGACWAKDDPEQNPWVWERKFEVDSLCYPVQLAYLLWKHTGCTSQFDRNFFQVIQKIFEVFRTEQYHEERSEYRFRRQSHLFRDTLSRDGKGALVKSGTGLIWSGFRPSDDACTYGYLIPSNMFAVVILGYLEEMAGALFSDGRREQAAGTLFPAGQSADETGASSSGRELSQMAELFFTAGQLGQEAKALREQIRAAIEKEGKVYTEEAGMIYAYEADGFGMYHLMDDANVPSLLSMDYLGYPSDPETAENTRRFILSEANPFYYKGAKAAGIGSPHTPPGYIWHIAMAMQGLTSKSREEKLEILRNMAATTGGKGVMHEGFSCEDDSRYTREWFSWANAMYAELFLDYLGYRLNQG